jgi:hypothetical protein
MMLSVSEIESDGISSYLLHPNDQQRLVVPDWGHPGLAWLSLETKPGFLPPLNGPLRTSFMISSPAVK